MLSVDVCQLECKEGSRTHESADYNFCFVFCLSVSDMKT